MDHTQPTELLGSITIDSIVKSISQTRDSFVKDLLNEPSLKKFIEQQFNNASHNAIKLEFLKRDLLELKNSSLDLVHYAALIKHMKEMNTNLVYADHFLIQKEVRSIFRKYGYASE